MATQKKAATTESSSANDMIDAGLAPDFRSDEERAKSTRKKQAKAVVNDVIAATKAEDAAPSDGSAAPAPIAKKTRKAKQAPKGEMTLAQVGAAYLKHLEERGAGAGTIASYGMELKTAQAELGADTRVAELTPERVQKYFDCDRVTKLKSGKEKSPLSIAKTRRVLRLALFYAADNGLIATAPITEKSPAA